MRTARPWFRSDRDAWYVQHGGKQVLLARGKANKAEATAAFHKLMAGGGVASPAIDSMPVASLCDMFLDFSEANHTRDVYDNYKLFLNAFCRQFGKLAANSIKPFHVNKWVDGKKSWKGAKHHAIVAVKRVYSWSIQQGLITVHPLKSLIAPRCNRRERIPTPEERRLILESIKDTAFRDFLTALAGTGCRPSEVAGVTAADFNSAMGVWVLKQHKTAKKTGRPRIIYLSPDMLALTQQQIEKHPTGPLFPNTRGKQFTRNAWRCRFIRLRKKFPNLAGVVCYSLRHSYATEALIKGVGIAELAELMGHTSTEMVARVYGHLAANVGHMRDAAAKATG